MASPNNLPHKIVIEYDYHKSTARKTFSDPYEARRFWIQKDREGKNPKVIKETSHG